MLLDLLPTVSAENYGFVITVLCGIGAIMCTIIALYTRAAIGLIKGWFATNAEQHATLMSRLDSLQAEVRSVERKAEQSIERHVGGANKRLGRFATDITDRVAHLEGQVGVKRPEPKRQWYEDSNVLGGSA